MMVEEPSYSIKIGDLYESSAGGLMYTESQI